jgi:signal transduction histidine kinase
VISPQFRQRALGLDLGIFGVLWINYVQVRLQIVRPLAGREAELRGFRDVGLAITSRLQLDEALKTIAAQAASLLHADGAAIFLRSGTAFELAAVHNMPERLVGHHLALGEGLTGKVAIEQRASRVEDYRRDWRGTSDMPYAREAFGAVVAVPLTFDNDVLGVLIVVENPLGKRFNRDDVRLLEMLGPQAAVAIANSRLFEKQQELDRLKNQMIRMTSHDLKNPLFAAMQHVELLQDEGRGVLTGEMEGDLRTIWTQLERMNRIIRGILDMERIQSGTPTYESFDIGELIRMAVSELADQAEAHGIELCGELPDALPSMVGDRHYLTQALVNLIENAIKFTPGAGKVCVRAEAVEGHIILHVSDTGVGIPPEAQARIFERFYRAHQNHPGLEQVSGSGLGLSLVKAVSDAHGGRVWLESVAGQGTTFHIALPVAGPKAE